MRVGWSWFTMRRMEGNRKGKMTIQPKYNVADVLELKANGNSSQIHEFHVQAILTVTGAEGTSIVYRGRLWIESREPWQTKPEDKPKRFCHRDVWEFTEDELLPAKGRD